MLRVGLTGGIGAGKSTVAAELASLGAVVVDADRIAREVVEPGTDGLAAVVEAFGDTVFQTVIHRTVRFPETTVAGEPITTWAPTSSGAAAFRDLAKEVIAL